MSVPFTMNYKEVYSQETVTKIEELLEDSYALEDIVEFIDANSEEDFRKYYEEYVVAGEEYSYEAVDAFIEEFGLQSFTSSAFEDAYMGQYDSKADYAEQYTSDVYSVEVPSFVEVDWEATFENLDVVFSANGYVFNTQF
jgi:Asp-tRNA(Asn)/Glu-tRNA(Gln) amidotransferase A subunit family amidase